MFLACTERKHHCRTLMFQELSHQWKPRRGPSQHCHMVQQPPHTATLPARLQHSLHTPHQITLPRAWLSTCGKLAHLPPLSGGAFANEMAASVAIQDNTLSIITPTPGRSKQASPLAATSLLFFLLTFYPPDCFPHFEKLITFVTQRGGLAGCPVLKLIHQQDTRQQQ